MRIICFFLTCCLYACLSAIAHAELMTIKPAAIVDVYDGDTFRVNIDSDSCPDILCKKLPIRVRGIDAPEIRAKCYAEFEQAKVARQYLASKLQSAATIELRDLKRDARFRLDATVYADGVNVADGMIAQELARPYAGGKRASWCNN